MDIFILSFNHKKCNIDFLGKINISSNKLKYFYNLLPFEEKVILQTCNRREFILRTHNPFYTRQFLYGFLIEFFNINIDDIKTLNDQFYGIDAFKHLIYVASGVESAIIGENQIFHQVKDAFNFSKNNNFAGKYFGKIFNEVFKLTRFIKNKTLISKGSVSIPNIVVNLLKEKAGINGKKILIIGTGEINKLIIKKINQFAPEIILLANRTYEEACKMAYGLNGFAIKFEDLKKYLKDIDIIISATLAPHYILKKEKIDDILRQRKKDLLIIDLAVPRDIDPEIANKKIKIFTIDDIKEIQNENLFLKIREIEKVKMIVNEEIKKINIDSLISSEIKI